MNQRMNTSWLIALIIATLSIAGCDSRSSSNDDADNGGTDGVELSTLQLDLAGAQGLMVTGPDGATTSAAAVNDSDFDYDEFVAATSDDDVVDLSADSLYKATTDGTLVRVEWTQEDGSEIPDGTLQPVKVREFNERFVGIGFESKDEFGNDIDLPYLVESSTGRAFGEEPNAPGFPELPLWSNLWEEQRTQTDQAGNIYLKDTEGRLFVIDVSNVETGETVSAVAVTSEGENLAVVGSFWHVSGAGDFVIYQAWIESRSESLTRVRPVGTSGFYELSGADPQYSNRGIRGPDGEIYIFDDGAGELLRVDFELDASSGPQAEFTSVGNVDGSTPFTTGQYFVAGRLILPDAGTEIDKIEPYEVIISQPSSKPIAELQDKLITLRDVATTDRFLFMLGRDTEENDLVLRWDGATGDVREFDFAGEDGDFNIEDFRVLNNARIWMRALRRSDEATIIAEVTEDGDVIIQSEIAAGDPDVIVLTPINPADFIVIDGQGREWPEDLRVLSGTAGSADEGDDLIHYREVVANNRYHGLVEFNGRIDPDNFTVIEISQTHEVRIVSGSATFKNGSDQITSLGDVGGISAIGSEVEFYVPLDAFDTGSPTVDAVHRMAAEEGEEEDDPPEPAGAPIDTLE